MVYVISLFPCFFFALFDYYYDVFICLTLHQKTGDTLLTVPISTFHTAQTVPKSISKPIGTANITVQGLLAAELAMNASKIRTPREVTPHTRKDFEDSMPVKWHPELQRLLPPVSLSLLAAQKMKIYSDWIAVSSAFPTLSYELYLYNWLRVGTRTFYYASHKKKVRRPRDGDDCLALVPLADYFNHADVGCEVTLSPSGYKVCAHRPIEKGEEVFVNYGSHGNDFLLLEYGFILDENKWDEISLDEVMLPLFSEEQRHELKAAGFLGNYAVDAEAVSYRVQLALRLLCMTPGAWQRFVASSLVDENEHQEAVNVMLVKALKTYLGKVQERLKQVEGLCCGLSSQRDTLSRRWKQIRRLLTITIGRIENST
ncbi:hypothetical protein MMC14_000323 [Varicellaria rhodocarpa]|nr:hypothetical protein [Varicellaria rhodocarpa]